MEGDAPTVQPLPYKHRNYFFYTLTGIFLVSLPFLFLYATGYRFELGNNSLVSTGGMYVAAERTGAEIYIDNELVRETRVFRRAFYAQSLEPGTHRVHVQKDGHHTWVKELPVYPHLVTEAQAFNLLLVPQVRIISPYRSVEGETVLFASSTLAASTTNQIVLATSTATTSLIADTEYQNIIELFSTSTGETSFTFLDRVSELTPELATTSAATSSKVATTTVEVQGFRLFERSGGIFVEYAGERDAMPYYYCAEAFDLLGTSTIPSLTSDREFSATAIASEPDLLQPTQQVTEESVCDQTIQISTQGQAVTSFDFFPSSTDFVLMALEDGVYVVEVDDRAWQNAQPLVVGSGLDMRVQNGNIYIYDGILIYQIQIER